MPNKSVASNSTWMALGTISSRITGVIRSAAVIAAIGFGTFADAFSIANSLPTIVYVVVVGGAINSVFVPQLVRHMKNDADGGVSYTNKLLTLVGLILFALTVITGSAKSLAIVIGIGPLSLGSTTEFPAKIRTLSRLKVNVSLILFIKSLAWLGAFCQY